MIRIIPAAVAFLLCASAAAAPRRLYVDARGNAPAEYNSALLASVADFGFGKEQLEVVRDERGADRVLILDLNVFFIRGENGKPSMHLTGRTGRTMAEAERAPRHARRCDECGVEDVWRLFHDVVDQTLLHPARGLYPPLRVQQCQAEGARRVKVVVAPAGGVAIEPSLLYYIARWTAAQREWVTEHRPWVGDFQGVDSGRTSATAYIRPRGDMVRTFRDSECKPTPPHAIGLVPRMFLLNTGKKNGDLPRATG